MEIIKWSYKGKIWIPIDHLPKSHILFREDGGDEVIEVPGDVFLREFHPAEVPA